MSPPKTDHLISSRAGRARPPQLSPGRTIAVLLAFFWFTPWWLFACNHADENGSAACTSTSRSADNESLGNQAFTQPSQSADGGITLEEQSQIPPGPPGVVDVAHGDGVAVIAWNGTRDDTISGYEVYRRCSSQKDGAWEKIGFVKLRDDDARNCARYTFEDKVPDVCQYTVAAVDQQGRPGPKTTEI